MTERYNKVFIRTCELGQALGWENISLSPGCQEHAIDEHWWFAINPHNQPNPCSAGPTVPPQTIYFMFNGWPAGFVNAFGGLMAAGSLANEKTLIDALEAAIARIEKGDPSPNAAMES